jgi:hypothetical protein
MSNNFINFVPSDTNSDSDPTCLPTSFGPRPKKKRSTVLIDSAQTIKIRDNEAREQIRAQPPCSPTARPFVPLKQINEYLEGKHKFHKTGMDDVTHYCALGRGKKLSPRYPAIAQLISNVKKYRLLSIDTEGKSGRIFLILSDFEGNVVLLNDAGNLPNELVGLINDVRIFKMQSDIAADFEVLRKYGIKITGAVDLKVVYRAFVTDVGNLGTAAQSEFLGFESRPFDYWTMNFQAGNKQPNEAAMLHAISDAHQLLLTLFKATQLRAAKMAIPLQESSNCFDLMWDICNRCTGVPARVAHKGQILWHTNDENWLTAKKERVAEDDINSCSEIFNIVGAQKDWPRSKLIKTRQLLNKYRMEEAWRKWNAKKAASYLLRHPEHPGVFVRKNN